MELPEATKQRITSLAEDLPKIKELGYNEGFEAGKQAEYDAFWDAFQNYGNRKNYTYAFHNETWSEWKQWNKTTLKPKYDLIPTSCDRMFYNILDIPDLGEHLAACGVKLDLSKSTRNSLTFMRSNFVKLPTIDCSNVTDQYSINQLFSDCKTLETIEKLIMSETIPPATGVFLSCVKLANITVEGVIGLSLSFSSSPLSVDSMKSVITHLKDYSGTTSEYTYTVTFKTSAFDDLEASGEKPPNGNTWAEYIDDLKWNLVKA